MPILEWKGKKQRKEFSIEKEKVSPFRIIDFHPSKSENVELVDNLQNLLIWGENTDVMYSLLTNFQNKITLIYIDPPFGTGGDFGLKVPIGENGEFIKSIAYEDKWRNGLASYLNFLYDRLIIMKKLLAAHGSIYVHLDWHISHYARLIMDEIFGIENFRNEIIWAYPAASVKTRKFFIRSYDIILFYSKSEEYTFNDDPDIYMEYSNRVKDALKKDDKGTFYYRGGSHDGKKLSRKVYVQHTGVFPRDVWSDIPYIRANTSEYQGFATQKPERLLKRIILASTNKDDIVADFFCGSGTTLAVAEKLRRHWIGCDINRSAIHMTRKRLLNIRGSKNILNWKENYKKDYSTFILKSIGNTNKLDLVPNVLFRKNVDLEKEIETLKFPDPIFRILQNQNEICIELEDYIINFNNIVSDEVKKNVYSFSDWVDYWAIDFKAKNNIFNTMWYSFRTPRNRSLSLSSIKFRYNKPGKYNVNVKVIDIFGIETTKELEVNII